MNSVICVRIVGGLWSLPTSMDMGVCSAQFCQSVLDGFKGAVTFPTVHKTSLVPEKTCLLDRAINSIFVSVLPYIRIKKKKKKHLSNSHKTKIVFNTSSTSQLHTTIANPLQGGVLCN